MLLKIEYFQEVFVRHVELNHSLYIGLWFAQCGTERIRPLARVYSFQTIYLFTDNSNMLKSRIHAYFLPATYISNSNGMYCIISGHSPSVGELLIYAARSEV